MVSPGPNNFAAENRVLDDEDIRQVLVYVTTA